MYRHYHKCIKAWVSLNPDETNSCIQKLWDLIRMSSGCYCLKIDYVCPAWMNILPAFESSFTTCDALGLFLVWRILSLNFHLSVWIDQNYKRKWTWLSSNHCPCYWVWRSDDLCEDAWIDATLYKRCYYWITAISIKSQQSGRTKKMAYFLSTLFVSYHWNNFQSTTGSIYELQLQMNTDPHSWLSYWRPDSERLRRYLTFFLSSSYVIWHKFYQMFVYRDLQSRLQCMHPDWREVRFHNSFWVS